ncbi:ABC-2 type transporter [Oesophagostomum dentatum]|uniref:ABC-2 type transporter n=1 Tax=Oesophagostomum dentatum TaxID=61180 RepID=A0A0B1TM03_OESDE|nr:ABC-2 type transporter [Oesophagostomum dentatum]
MRDPAVLHITLIQTIICAVTTGFVYFGTPVTSETIISVNGILFNHIRNLNFMLQFPAVPAITAELPIVLRENSNGVYTASAYFLGKNIAELPKYIVLPALYNVIVYWMSGLFPNVWTFLFATLICALMTNVAISVSYAVATIFGSTDVAMTLLPIFVVPMLAFGGFFITYDAIPGYFTWLSELSYFKYGYEALAINEWEMIDTIPDRLRWHQQMDRRADSFGDARGDTRHFLRGLAYTSLPQPLTYISPQKGVFQDHF